MKPDEVIFVEVKKPNGKTSKLQDFRLNELSELDFTVCVAYGYEDYLEKLGKYL
jgi:hypothetical protein